MLDEGLIIDLSSLCHISKMHEKLYEYLQKAYVKAVKWSDECLKQQKIAATNAENYENLTNSENARSLAGLSTMHTTFYANLKSSNN